MRKNKNKKIKCTLCQSSRLKVIYNDDIRSGLFSKQTREKYKVVKYAAIRVNMGLVILPAMQFDKRKE